MCRSQRALTVQLSAARLLITNYWLPALEQSQPQMLFISAGFDAHREDSLAQLQLDNADYVWVTQQFKKFAKKAAHGRIVPALEGRLCAGCIGSLCSRAY